MKVWLSLTADGGWEFYGIEDPGEIALYCREDHDVDPDDHRDDLAAGAHALVANAIERGAE